jgi:hypothetical protein
VLDDRDSEQRRLGIEAGFAWREVSHATIVYTDLGVTSGMKHGILHAEKRGATIEYRTLGESWDTVVGDLATARWGR